jgi:hypothetical protein
MALGEACISTILSYIFAVLSNAVPVSHQAIGNINLK